jgi:hypothetical protein
MIQLLPVALGAAFLGYSLVSKIGKEDEKENVPSKKPKNKNVGKDKPRKNKGRKKDKVGGSPPKINVPKTVKTPAKKEPDTEEPKEDDVLPVGDDDEPETEKEVLTEEPETDKIEEETPEPTKDDENDKI